MRIPDACLSFRLGASYLIRLFIEAAYHVDRLISGGKTGEYWFAPKNTTRTMVDASFYQAYDLG